MQKIIGLISVLIIVSLFSCLSSEGNQKENKPPNIVLIMGDDMGFSDIGCYGGEIKTPRLDALADDGLRLTQFYNAARCCPTRASLLTGLYPHQAGVGYMVTDRGTPAFKGDLSSQAVTIAEVLKEAGYATYMSGKWHVTPFSNDNPDKQNWPLQRGFDRFFGTIAGAGSFYDPRSLTDGNDLIAPRDGFYCTTDFTNYALQCIDEHQDDKPFFMYLSYTAAHWPLHAPAAAIEKYKGQYDGGWDEVRQTRFKKMQEMGILNPEWALTDRDSFVPAWNDDISDKEWELANMETYAAMVTLMDEGIGQVVDALEAKGELDNTLILYLQDNGACKEVFEWFTYTPKENVQPMQPGELQTQLIPPITRDGEIMKFMKAAMPGPADSYTAYGLPWANASNTPFREYKHWVHEGGIATPLIAHWPDGIKDGGAFRRQPTHLVDIMATAIDVSGGKYPTTYNSNPIPPMEGKSLVPLFDNQSLDREEALYWEHEGNRAVRMGKWKLVSKVDKKDAMVWDKTEELPIENWALFDMDKDRTETKNIADAHPQLVQEMADKWMRWGKRVGAIPRPLNENY